MIGSRRGRRKAALVAVVAIATGAALACGLPGGGGTKLAAVETVPSPAEGRMVLRIQAPRLY